jgi:hypothetical protein
MIQFALEISNTQTPNPAKGNPKGEIHMPFHSFFFGTLLLFQWILDGIGRKTARSTAVDFVFCWMLPATFLRFFISKASDAGNAFTSPRECLHLPPPHIDAECRPHNLLHTFCQVATPPPLAFVLYPFTNSLSKIILQLLNSHMRYNILAQAAINILFII